LRFFISIKTEYVVLGDPNNEKTPLNFLQAGRTAGPEQRRGR
jgi:hypothetical protein